MNNNSLKPEEEREKKKLEEIVDDAIKSDNFKDVNEFIANSIDQAIDFTRSSIGKLFGAVEKRPYSVQYDDNIINQNPKSFRRIKSLNRLCKLSIGFHLFMAMGLMLDGIQYNYRLIGMFLFWIIPAIILSVLGLKKSHRLKEQEIRFQKYRREIGNSTVIPIADLSVVVGKDKGFVVHELQEFITKDYFRQGRLVENNEIFILDSNTYKLYKEHKLKESERPEILTEGSVDEELATKAKYYVTELTTILEGLENPMKSKVAKLLSTIQKIFAHVKTHPEDSDNLNKFIEYYLPTTVKLCDSYKSMSGSEAGENVQESMKEIEQTLNTINEAFIRLLDNLYADQLIDISSDISVLKTMLKQEGLLDEDFTIRR